MILVDVVGGVSVSLLTLRVVVVVAKELSISLCSAVVLRYQYVFPIGVLPQTTLLAWHRHSYSVYFAHTISEVKWHLLCSLHIIMPTLISKRLFSFICCPRDTQHTTFDGIDTGDSRPFIFGCMTPDNPNCGIVFVTRRHSTSRW